VLGGVEVTDHVRSGRLGKLGVRGDTTCPPAHRDQRAGYLAPLRVTVGVTKHQQSLEQRKGGDIAQQEE
jgi:hypothetical protein